MQTVDDTRLESSTDSEVAFRVGVAGALGASSPLSLPLFKFGVVCAVEFACIESMGEMFEPWVMRDGAVLGLVRTLRAKPVLR